MRGRRSAAVLCTLARAHVTMGSGQAHTCECTLSHRSLSHRQATKSCWVADILNHQHIHTENFCCISHRREALEPIAPEVSPAAQPIMVAAAAAAPLVPKPAIFLPPTGSSIRKSQSAMQLGQWKRLSATDLEALDHAVGEAFDASKVGL